MLDDLLGLADHLKVRLRVKMRAGGHIRSTDAYWLAVQMDEIDQVDEIRLLVEHTADHHEIGPVEVRVRQRFGVTVDETDVPMLRQHGGDRDQAEWRGRILRANQFAGFRIVPERVRNELRIDHQDTAENRHVPPRRFGGRVSRSLSGLKGSILPKSSIAGSDRPTYSITSTRVSKIGGMSSRRPSAGCLRAPRLLPLEVDHGIARDRHRITFGRQQNLKHHVSRNSSSTAAR